MALPPAKETRPDRATLLAFVTVALLGGTNALAVKETVIELAPLWGAGIRFLAAGTLTMGLVLVTRRSLPRGRSLLGAGLFGFFGFTAAYGLIYTAIRDVPAGTTMVLVSLTPLFTFGLAIAHRQERFRMMGLVGAVIAVVGVGIVFADQLGSDVPIGSLLLIVLGAAAIAESGVIVKAIPRSDPLATNGVAMLVGGLLLTGLSVAFSERWTVPAESTTWIALAYLVFFGSIALFVLYVFALQRWTASAVSYVTLLMPIVTVALAAVLTGEQITPSFLVGSVVVLGGVYVGAFVTFGPRRTPTTSLPECLPTENDRGELRDRPMESGAG